MCRIDRGARVRLDNGTWSCARICALAERRSHSFLFSFATPHIFQFLSDVLIGLGCRASFYRLVIVFWDIKGRCMYVHDARGTVTEVQYLLYTAFHEYNR